MIRFSKIIIAFFASLSCLYSFGQDVTLKDRLYFEADGHYGFVIPHMPAMAYFITDHVKGFQFNMGILTNGEKKWHSYYNYPRLGVGFYHSGLGNDEVYGKVSALFGYFDRYFFKLDKPFNIGSRLSFGLSYITKKYDLKNDYFDVVIGSNINVYINYSVEGLVRVSPLVQMKLGFGITHFSNGRFREPNKGINLATTFVGFQYSFKDPTKIISTHPDETDEPGKNQFIVMGAIGEKQISRKYDYSYWPTALSGEFAHKISYTSWIGLALTAYYDPSLKKEIELEGDTAKNGDNIRLALNFSYELKMGRFSYVFQPGFYLKNAYKEAGAVSNKVSLRYQVNPRWLAAITIKAHYPAIADFIEWGVGYRWNN
jgi:hypothetical protein